MSDWSWAPQYRLYLSQSGQTWSLKTLQSAQCLLQTGQGVNQASIVIADPDGFIKKRVDPHAMARVELWTTNRFGQGGVVWSGYVDEVHKMFDPDQGSHLSLTCTGPVKLFEITRQSPGDVAGLAIASYRNIAASSILRFAARACGYPSSMLNIHPVADSGSGFQQGGPAALMQPDQQPWSTVVSALQANSAIEWFFGARGELYWRQLNFLEPWFPTGKGRPHTIRPRVISEDDILHADMAESDAGVVTDVQVRWFGGGGFVQSAANWPEPGHESQAHKNMVSHLRTRRLVVYAPWITTKPAAQYLAQVLYTQYSAGVAQASVTIPADPLIEVGSLVDVPSLGTGGTQTTRYYVSSITAQLQWGGAWVYTLGLAYGRAPDQSFPYVGTVTFPALTKAVTKDAPRPAGITPYNTATGPYYDDTPYAIVAQSWLNKDQAAVVSSAYPVGSVIYIWTKPHSAGKLIGPAPVGEYTTVAPLDPTQADTTIALLSTKYSIGYVTVKGVGPAIAPEVGAGAEGGVSAYNTTAAQPATGVLDTASISRTPAARGPVRESGTIPLRALLQATVWVDYLYKWGHAGPDGYDCSGLVSAAYAAIDIPNMIYLGGGGSYNTDVGPNGIYNFFLRNGAQEIDPSAAVGGDLLFVRGSGGSQQGFEHVAFCSAPGENFGANGPEGTKSIGYTPLSYAPFNLALRMSTVTWGHLS